MANDQLIMVVDHLIHAGERWFFNKQPSTGIDDASWLIYENQKMNDGKFMIDNSLWSINLLVMIKPMVNDA